MFKQWRSRNIIAGLSAFLIVATVAGLIPGAAVATAASNLTVSPKVVVFSPTTFGETAYEEVVVTNNGANAERLVSGGTTSHSFRADLGGTCQSNEWILAAGQECTVKFKFTPTRAGGHVGEGVLTFRNTETLDTADLWVRLRGRATR